MATFCMSPLSAVSKLRACGAGGTFLRSVDGNSLVAEIAMLIRPNLSLLVATERGDRPISVDESEPYGVAFLSQHDVAANKNSLAATIGRNHLQVHLNAEDVDTDCRPGAADLLRQLCVLGGAEAYLNGEPPADGPWDAGSVEWRWWERGWLSARSGAAEDVITRIPGDPL